MVDAMDKDEFDVFYEQTNEESGISIVLWSVVFVILLIVTIWFYFSQIEPGRKRKKSNTIDEGDVTQRTLNTHKPRKSIESLESASGPSDEPSTSTGSIQNYEIIDGEVRINHSSYDGGNIVLSSRGEDIAQRSLVRRPSMEDMSLIFPGTLPVIVEEEEDEDDIKCCKDMISETTDSVLLGNDSDDSKSSTNNTFRNVGMGDLGNNIDNISSKISSNSGQSEIYDKQGTSLSSVGVGRHGVYNNKGKLPAKETEIRHRFRNSESDGGAKNNLLQITGQKTDNSVKRPIRGNIRITLVTKSSVPKINVDNTLDPERMNELGLRTSISGPPAHEIVPERAVVSDIPSRNNKSLSLNEKPGDQPNHGLDANDCCNKISSKATELIYAENSLDYVNIGAKKTFYSVRELHEKTPEMEFAEHGTLKEDVCPGKVYSDECISWSKENVTDLNRTPHYLEGFSEVENRETSLTHAWTFFAMSDGSVSSEGERLEPLDGEQLITLHVPKITVGSNEIDCPPEPAILATNHTKGKQFVDPTSDKHLEDFETDVDVDDLILEEENELHERDNLSLYLKRPVSVTDLDKVLSLSEENLTHKEHLRKEIKTELSRETDFEKIVQEIAAESSSAVNRRSFTETNLDERFDNLEEIRARSLKDLESSLSLEGIESKQTMSHSKASKYRWVSCDRVYPTSENERNVSSTHSSSYGDCLNAYSESGADSTKRKKSRITIKIVTKKVVNNETVSREGTIVNSCYDAASNGISPLSPSNGSSGEKSVNMDETACGVKGSSAEIESRRTGKEISENDNASCFPSDGVSGDSTQQHGQNAIEGGPILESARPVFLDFQPVDEFNSSLVLNQEQCLAKKEAGVSGVLNVGTPSAKADYKPGSQTASQEKSQTQHALTEGAFSKEDTSRHLEGSYREDIAKDGNSPIAGTHSKDTTVKAIGTVDHDQHNARAMPRVTQRTVGVTRDTAISMKDIVDTRATFDTVMQQIVNPIITQGMVKPSVTGDSITSDCICVDRDIQDAVTHLKDVDIADSSAVQHTGAPTVESVCLDDVFSPMAGYDEVTQDADTLRNPQRSVLPMENIDCVNASVTQSNVTPVEDRAAMVTHDNLSRMELCIENNTSGYGHAIEDLNQAEDSHCMHDNHVTVTQREMECDNAADSLVTSGITFASEENECFDTIISDNDVTVKSNQELNSEEVTHSHASSNVMVATQPADLNSDISVTPSIKLSNNFSSTQSAKLNDVVPKIDQKLASEVANVTQSSDDGSDVPVTVTTVTGTITPGVTQQTVMPIVTQGMVMPSVTRNSITQDSICVDRATSITLNSQSICVTQQGSTGNATSNGQINVLMAEICADREEHDELPEEFNDLNTQPEAVTQSHDALLSQQILPDPAAPVEDTLLQPADDTSLDSHNVTLPKKPGVNLNILTQAEVENVKQGMKDGDASQNSVSSPEDVCSDIAHGFPAVTSSGNITTSIVTPSKDVDQVSHAVDGIRPDDDVIEVPFVTQIICEDTKLAVMTLNDDYVSDILYGISPDDVIDTQTVTPSADVKDTMSQTDDGPSHAPIVAPLHDFCDNSLAKAYLTDEVVFTPDNSYESHVTQHDTVVIDSPVTQHEVLQVAKTKKVTKQPQVTQDGLPFGYEQGMTTLKYGIVMPLPVMSLPDMSLPDGFGDRPFESLSALPISEPEVTQQQEVLEDEKDDESSVEEDQAVEYSEPEVTQQDTVLGVADNASVPDVIRFKQDAFQFNERPLPDVTLSAAEPDKDVTQYEEQLVNSSTKNEISPPLIKYEQLVTQNGPHPIIDTKTQCVTPTDVAQTPKHSVTDVTQTVTQRYSQTARDEEEVVPILAARSMFKLGGMEWEVLTKEGWTSLDNHKNRSGLFLPSDHFLELDFPEHRLTNTKATAQEDGDRQVIEEICPVLHNRKRSLKEGEMSWDGETPAKKAFNENEAVFQEASSVDVNFDDVFEVRLRHGKSNTTEHAQDVCEDKIAPVFQQNAELEDVNELLEASLIRDDKVQPVIRETSPVHLYDRFGKWTPLEKGPRTLSDDHRVLSDMQVFSDQLSNVLEEDVKSRVVPKSGLRANGSNKVVEDIFPVKKQRRQSLNGLDVLYKRDSDSDLFFLVPPTRNPRSNDEFDDMLQKHIRGPRKKDFTTGVTEEKISPVLCERKRSIDVLGLMESDPTASKRPSALNIKPELLRSLNQNSTQKVPEVENSVQLQKTSLPPEVLNNKQLLHKHHTATLSRRQETAETETSGYSHLENLKQSEPEDSGTCYVSPQKEELTSFGESASNSLGDLAGELRTATCLSEPEDSGTCYVSPQKEELTSLVDNASNSLCDLAGELRTATCLPEVTVALENTAGDKRYVTHSKEATLPLSSTTDHVEAVTHSPEVDYPLSPTANNARAVSYSPEACYPLSSASDHLRGVTHSLKVVDSLATTTGDARYLTHSPEANEPLATRAGELPTVMHSPEAIHPLPSTADKVRTVTHSQEVVSSLTITAGEVRSVTHPSDIFDSLESKADKVAEGVKPVTQIPEESEAEIKPVKQPSEQIEPEEEPVTQTSEESEPEEEPMTQIPEESRSEAKPVVHIPEESEPEVKNSKQTPEESEPDVNPLTQIPEEIETEVKPLSQILEEIETEVKPMTQIPEEIETEVKPMTQIPEEIETEVKPMTQIPEEIETEVKPMTQIPEEIETEVKLVTQIPQEIETEVKPMTEIPEEIETEVKPMTQIPEEIETEVKPMTQIPEEIETEVKPMTQIPEEIETEVKPMTQIPEKIETEVKPMTQIPEEIETEVKPVTQTSKEIAPEVDSISSSPEHLPEDTLHTDDSFEKCEAMSEAEMEIRTILYKNYEVTETEEVYIVEKTSPPIYTVRHAKSHDELLSAGREDLELRNKMETPSGRSKPLGTNSPQLLVSQINGSGVIDPRDQESLAARVRVDEIIGSTRRITILNVHKKSPGASRWKSMSELDGRGGSYVAFAGKNASNIEEQLELGPSGTRETVFAVTGVSPTLSSDSRYTDEESRSSTRVPPTDGIPFEESKTTATLASPDSFSLSSVRSSATSSPITNRPDSKRLPNERVNITREPRRSPESSLEMDHRGQHRKPTAPRYQPVSKSIPVDRMSVIRASKSPSALAENCASDQDALEYVPFPSYKSTRSSVPREKSGKQQFAIKESSKLPEDTAKQDAKASGDRQVVRSKITSIESVRLDVISPSSVLSDGISLPSTRSDSVSPFSIRSSENASPQFDRTDPKRMSKERIFAVKGIRPNDARLETPSPDSLRSSANNSPSFDRLDPRRVSKERIFALKGVQRSNAPQHKLDNQESNICFRTISPASSRSSANSSPRVEHSAGSTPSFDRSDPKRISKERIFVIKGRRLSVEQDKDKPDGTKTLESARSSASSTPSFDRLDSKRESIEKTFVPKSDAPSLFSPSDSQIFMKKSPRTQEIKECVPGTYLGKAQNAEDAIAQGVEKKSETVLFDDSSSTKPPVNVNQGGVFNRSDPIRKSKERLFVIKGRRTPTHKDDPDKAPSMSPPSVQSSECENPTFERSDPKRKSTERMFVIKGHRTPTFDEVTDVRISDQDRASSFSPLSTESKEMASGLDRGDPRRRSMERLFALKGRKTPTSDLDNNSSLPKKKDSSSLPTLTNSGKDKQSRSLGREENQRGSATSPTPSFSRSKEISSTYQRIPLEKAFEPKRITEGIQSAQADRKRENECRQRDDSVSPTPSFASSKEISSKYKMNQPESFVRSEVKRESKNRMLSDPSDRKGHEKCDDNSKRHRDKTASPAPSFSSSREISSRYQQDVYRRTSEDSDFGRESTDGENSYHRARRDPEKGRDTKSSHQRYTLEDGEGAGRYETSSRADGDKRSSKEPRSPTGSRVNDQRDLVHGLDRRTSDPTGRDEMERHISRGYNVDPKKEEQVRYREEKGSPIRRIHSSQDSSLDRRRQEEHRRHSEKSAREELRNNPRKEGSLEMRQERRRDRPASNRPVSPQSIQRRGKGGSHDRLSSEQRSVSPKSGLSERREEGVMESTRAKNNRVVSPSSSIDNKSRPKYNEQLVEEYLKSMEKHLGKTPDIEIQHPVLRDRRNHSPSRMRETERVRAPYRDRTHNHDEQRSHERDRERKRVSYEFERDYHRRDEERKRDMNERQRQEKRDLHERDADRGHRDDRNNHEDPRRGTYERERNRNRDRYDGDEKGDSVQSNRDGNHDRGTHGERSTDPTSLRHHRKQEQTGMYAKCQKGELPTKLARDTDKRKPSTEFGQDSCPDSRNTAALKRAENKYPSLEATANVKTTKETQVVMKYERKDAQEDTRVGLAPHDARKLSSNEEHDKGVSLKGRIPVSRHGETGILPKEEADASCNGEDCQCLEKLYSGKELKPASKADSFYGKTFRITKTGWLEKLPLKALESEITQDMAPELEVEDDDDDEEFVPGRESSIMVTDLDALLGTAPMPANPESETREIKNVEKEITTSKSVESYDVRAANVKETRSIVPVTKYKHPVLQEITHSETTPSGIQETDLDELFQEKDDEDRVINKDVTRCIRVQEAVKATRTSNRVLETSIHEFRYEQGHVVVDAVTSLKEYYGDPRGDHMVRDHVGPRPRAQPAIPSDDRLKNIGKKIDPDVRATPDDRNRRCPEAREKTAGIDSGEHQEALVVGNTAVQLSIEPVSDVVTCKQLPDHARERSKFPTALIQAEHNPGAIEKNMLVDPRADTKSALYPYTKDEPVIPTAETYSKEHSKVHQTQEAIAAVYLANTESIIEAQSINEDEELDDVFTPDTAGAGSDADSETSSTNSLPLKPRSRHTRASLEAVITTPRRTRNSQSSSESSMTTETGTRRKPLKPITPLTSTPQDPVFGLTREGFIVRSSRNAATESGHYLTSHLTAQGNELLEDFSIGAPQSKSRPVSTGYLLECSELRNSAFTPVRQKKYHSDLPKAPNSDEERRKVSFGESLERKSEEEPPLFKELSESHQSMPDLHQNRDPRVPYHARLSAHTRLWLSQTAGIDTAALCKDDSVGSEIFLYPSNRFQPGKSVDASFLSIISDDSPDDVSTRPSSPMSEFSFAGEEPMFGATSDGVTLIACGNPYCRREDVLYGNQKSSFTSCPACYTYYCTRECRRAHWREHKKVCHYGRINSYIRSFVYFCHKKENLKLLLSKIATINYEKKGRGCVMVTFNSPQSARKFMTSGCVLLPSPPSFSTTREVKSEGVISKHKVALLQTLKDYDPETELVLNLAIVAGRITDLPTQPVPRQKSSTVLQCIKVPLSASLQTPKPEGLVPDITEEVRVFHLPKCVRHDFVNAMEARRHYCRNISKQLKDFGIRLKKDYPEKYDKLCMYVERNIPFEPLVVFGNRGSKIVTCKIMPEGYSSETDVQ
ncbi:uncharacterized protein LOC116603144 isoform X2 [Nematostella vectensis]|uniref:uncharacterized protein LOC116603144 isoform X2 n=1 Tax=Nematostella vectensis TaxID=45351 RepID=UPI002076E611|nr:uncharacterized protein LOC116603144 isoform X2 [Nematostella vectensis]